MRSVIVGGGIWTWLGFELWTNNQVQLMCIGLDWCSVDHTWNCILVWESDPKMAFCRFGNQYLPSLYMTLYVMKSNYQSEQHHKIIQDPMNCPGSSTFLSSNWAKEMLKQLVDDKLDLKAQQYTSPASLLWVSTSTYNSLVATTWTCLFDVLTMLSSFSNYLKQTQTIQG